MNDTLKEHTLSRFDDKLDGLTSDLVEMGALVRESVRMAGTALVSGDESVFKEVKRNDKDVNAFDDGIQKQVTEIIALMNPMAVDLRFITSALRIAIALERAGDLAKNITKRMVRLKVSLPEEAQVKMQELVEVVMQMLDDALEAVSEKCVNQATDVWRRDSEADDLCRDVFLVIKEEMKKDPESAYVLADVMFAAKNFERIADYATNIAKTVHYVASGKNPKKSVLKQAGE